MTIARNKRVNGLEKLGGISTQAGEFSASKEREREGRRSTEGPTPLPIVLRWAEEAGRGMEEEDLREQ